MDGELSGGGSRAVLSVLDRCGSAVYADLLRYFGVDLGGLVESPPSLSPKKVLVLVENLPMECMTSALLRGVEQSYGWDSTAYLLAGVIDSVRENTHVNMQVRTKKKLKPPEPVQVPGMEREKKRNSQFVRMAQAALAKQNRS